MILQTVVAREAADVKHKLKPSSKRHTEILCPPWCSDAPCLSAGMEGWNKWCFGSGEKVRVKNTAGCKVCHWLDGEVMCLVRGNIFFLLYSVKGKIKKLQHTRLHSGITKLGCNCRCCHLPLELPPELLLKTLQLCWLLSFFTLLYLYLFLSDFSHIFPSYWLLFSLPLLLHLPTHPKLLCLLMSLPHSCLFSSMVPTLFSLLDRTGLLSPSVAECIPPPQRESLPAAWSHGPLRGSLQCHHGVICRGLAAAGWSYSCIGGVRYRNYCQRSSGLDWVCSNKQSGENLPAKLKPPSSLWRMEALCKQNLRKQRVFLESLIMFGQLVTRAVKDIAAWGTPLAFSISVTFSPHRSAGLTPDICLPAPHLLSEVPLFWRRLIFYYLNSILSSKNIIWMQIQESQDLTKIYCCFIWALSQRWICLDFTMMCLDSFKTLIIYTPSTRKRSSPFIWGLKSGSQRRRGQILM